MRYRTLGRSGIRVSEIGFGAWAIAMDWWGRRVERDEALRMLRRAHDLGINFFETADMYGAGLSERLIGEAFGGMRDDVVISTKYGYDFENAEQTGHSELPQDFGERFTRRALAASLERLRTRRLDVYGLHNPKMRHIRDDAVFATLDALRAEGLIGAYQAALGPAIGWEQEGIEAMRRPGTAAVQTVYNILEQTPGNSLIEHAARSGTGILVRVPDASGILTGKVGADTMINASDHRSVRKAEWIRASLAKVEQLRPIAERNGLSIAELAIKFVLSSAPVSSVLPTVVSVEEVEQFAAMSDERALSSGDLAEIESLYSSWPAYELKASTA